MFHDGTIRENLNFKQICPIKQKESVARITYEKNFELDVFPDGEMNMGEYRYTLGCHPGDCDSFNAYGYFQPEWKNGLERSLLRSAVDQTKLPGGTSAGVGYTKVPWNWEILKIFFIEYNVKPVWIGHYEYYDQTKCDTDQCSGMLRKVFSYRMNP